MGDPDTPTSSKKVVITALLFNTKMIKQKISPNSFAFRVMEIINNKHALNNSAK